MMKKEILEEIENIAPNLVKIGNRNPFTLPEQYFENLELEEGVSVKSDMQKMPADYFINLSDEIIGMAKSKSTSRLISINAKRWLAAASVALLFVASYSLMNSSENIDENISFAQDIELEEAFDYLTGQDEIYMSEVLAFGQLDIFEKGDEEFNDMELDFILDEVSLDDLDDLQ